MATDPDAPAAPSPLATGRGVELVLLAFAAVLVTAALVLVEANQGRAGADPTDNTDNTASTAGALDAAPAHLLRPELLYIGLAYLALFTVAHLAVRRYARYADPLILPCVALLNGLGLVEIHRLDLAAAGRPDGPAAEVVYRQVAWTTIGLVLFVVVLARVRDHRVLARYGYTAGLAGLVLLALPGVLPASLSEINGAKLWLKLGLFSIQPAEFAKILLIVFFAALLVQKRALLTSAGRRVLGMELPRPRDLGPLLLAWGASIGVLISERDLGTSLLFFGIVLALLYTATERIGWLVVGLGFFAVGAYAAYRLFGHVQRRVQIWLDPFGDYTGSGYQIGQAQFGLGTGGVGGTGLGVGRPYLVPYAQSDFMLSSLGEELGLLGLIAILLIYLLLCTHGLRSALAVRDNFGTLLATGLSFALALQIFVVVGGVSRLIPLTGLTLPFLSYGGSSLVANYALVALLLRISDAGRAPRPARPSTAPAPTRPTPTGPELVSA